MQSNILGAELAPFAPESRYSQVNRQPDNSEVFQSWWRFWCERCSGKEVSHLSGEHLMRNRLRPISVSRKGRRKLASRAPLLLALLALCLPGLTLFSDFKSTASGATMQLVRLNITTDAGLVRIEIVADGSFDDATIEHFSRGRQTVFRVRGARSLLRQSYEIDEAVAREVRTASGEKDGEPYVDLLISLGDGATVAQKKSFNRLVIGVASDFARLRHRSPTSGDVAKSRPESSTPRAVGVPALPSVATNNLPVVMPELVRTNISPAINTPFDAHGLQGSAAPPALLASAAPTIFRGHTIWNNFSAASSKFAHFNTAGFLPMFFQAQNGATNGTQPVLANFINMTLEPPGAIRGEWVPGTTASERDDIGGKPLGSGFLRPSFTLGATYDDNFFYRSGIGRNLGIFTVAPRIEYELPGETRALRLAYEARLRRLSNGAWANGHTFDFDSRFDLGNYLRLGLRNHFVRSALDPREYDPAGEVYIVGDTFNRDDVGLRLEYKLGERNRLALDGDYNIVRWSKDHIAGAPLFLNYDEASSGITFERDISEETTALASFTYTSGVSTVPLRPRFSDLGDFRRYVLEFGARMQVTETSGAAFKVGYERSIFRNAPDANDYSGLVFDLRFRRDLTTNTNFELAALRKTQLSAFNLEGGNVRLVSTGGAARFENTQTENLKLALGLNYQQLGFPLSIVPTTTASGGIFVGQFAGERRKDHLYGFSFEAAYRWSDLVGTRFVYSFSRRDSTIPVFTFNRNRLSLVFEIGRRNDTKGRPF
jgi:hypothetical protein